MLSNYSSLHDLTAICLEQSMLDRVLRPQLLTAPELDSTRCVFLKMFILAKIGEYSCYDSMIIFILADNIASVPPVLV